jgi:hypothetical protein
MRLRARFLLTLVAAVLLVGCESTGSNPVQAPAATGANPTPLARALSDSAPPASNPASIATSKPTPKATAKPRATAKPKTTPRPTAKTASFYKPPGWDGHSDVDCPDFDTHAHAQSFFKGTGGSRTHDPYRLDADHDGIACESLP